MRISDWSSDVCSSDLLAFRKDDRHFAAVHADFEGRADGAHPLTGCGNREGPGGIVRDLEEGAAAEQFDVPLAGHIGEAHIRFGIERDERSVGKRDRRALACFGLDRKSTRLNSSLMRISYAVFCLKKKS